MYLPRPRRGQTGQGCHCNHHAFPHLSAPLCIRSSLCSYHKTLLPTAPLSREFTALVLLSQRPVSTNCVSSLADDRRTTTASRLTRCTCAEFLLACPVSPKFVIILWRANALCTFHVVMTIGDYPHGSVTEQARAYVAAAPYHFANLPSLHVNESLWTFLGCERVVLVDDQVMNPGKHACAHSRPRRRSICTWNEDAIQTI